MAGDPRDDEGKMTPKELDSVKLWQGKAARYKAERDTARTKVSELQTQLNHAKISVEGQKAITSMSDDAERARCADIEALKQQLDDEKARVAALDSLHQTLMGYANEDRRAAIVVLKALLQPCEGSEWCSTPDAGNEFHRRQHKGHELVRRLEVYLGTSEAKPFASPAPEGVAFVVSKPEDTGE